MCLSSLLAVHYFDSVMLTLTRNESDGSVPVTVRRRRYMQRETTVVVQPVIDTAPNAAGNSEFSFLGGQLSSQ